MALRSDWGPDDSLRRQAIPAQLPRRGNRLTRALAWWQFRLRGWDLRGRYPASQSQFIIIAAPHTSNWDMINGMAVQFALGVKFRFVMKASWFRGPLGPFMRWLGGVPIERGAGGSGVTEASVAAFAKHDPLILLITPEGTRAPVTSLKKGFYHIAHAAEVPLLVVSFRYGEKLISLDGFLEAGEDYAPLEAQLKAHWAPIRGLNGQFPARAADGVQDG